MAAPALTIVSKVRGWLVKSPANNNSPPTYGGTILGATRAHVFAPNQRTFEHRSPTYGVTVDELDLGMSAVFTAILRGWDEDAIAAIFPIYATTGGRNQVYFDTTHSTGAAGTWVSQYAFPLLFAPLNPTTHKAIYFYAALPRLRQTAEMAMQANAPMEIPVMFTAAPAVTTGIPFRWGKLADMTIP